MEGKDGKRGKKVKNGKKVQTEKRLLDSAPVTFSTAAGVLVFLLL